MIQFSQHVCYLFYFCSCVGLHPTLSVSSVPQQCICVMYIHIIIIICKNSIHVYLSTAWILYACSMSHMLLYSICYMRPIAFNCILYYVLWQPLLWQARRSSIGTVSSCSPAARHSPRPVDRLHVEQFKGVAQLSGNFCGGPFWGPMVFDKQNFCFIFHNLDSFFILIELLTDYNFLLIN